MKVGVLYGGDSPEREVSLKSGPAVTAAMEEAGFDVHPLPVGGARDVLALLEGGWREFVFVALHGGWGEDGRLQALLDMAGLPYSGSGPAACFAAMDKEVSRALFRERNIPVAPGLVCTGAMSLSAERNEETEKLFALSGRLVVKPAGCGSTVGISIVDDGESLIRAVEAARKYDRKVIIESYIDGRELTVTVLDEKDHLTALPVVEIVPPEGFYTYEAKYTPGASRYVAPAVLTVREKDAVVAAALAAHRALDCGVYSRVDLRLDGDGRPCVLEVNTAPGMTETSLVPKAAQAAGLSFAELLARIVRASLERF